jgi:hypothetical protein
MTGTNEHLLVELDLANVEIEKLAERVHNELIRRKTLQRQRQAEAERVANQERLLAKQKVETEEAERLAESRKDAFEAALLQLQQCFSHPLKFTASQLSPNEWRAKNSDLFGAISDKYVVHRGYFLTVQDFVDFLDSHVQLKIETSGQIKHFEYQTLKPLLKTLCWHSQLSPLRNASFHLVQFAHNRKTYKVKLNKRTLQIVKKMYCLFFAAVALSVVLFMVLLFTK